MRLSGHKFTLCYRAAESHIRNKEIGLCLVLVILASTTLQGVRCGGRREILRALIALAKTFYNGRTRGLTQVGFENLKEGGMENNGEQKMTKRYCSYSPKFLKGSKGVREQRGQTATFNKVTSNKEG